MLTPKRRKPKTDSPSWEEGMGAREKEIKAWAKIEGGRERKFVEHLPSDDRVVRLPNWMPDIFSHSNHFFFSRTDPTGPRSARLISVPMELFKLCPGGNPWSA
jgi:hypothetical protein